MTSYSITENPFVYGLNQVSYKDTNKKFSPNYKRRVPLGIIADTSYFAGRTIRLGVSILGAVADLALQFFQILLYTPAFLIIKLETLVNKSSRTYSRVLAIPGEIVGIIRDFTTKIFFKSLTEDIKSIGKHFAKNDFVNIYATLFQKYIFE